MKIVVWKLHPSKIRSSVSFKVKINVSLCFGKFYKVLWSIDQNFCTNICKLNYSFKNSEI